MHKFIFLIALVITVNNLKAKCVAILDTGVDASLSAFNPHLTFNPKESLNNFDDDGNGLIDDRQGWNFIEQSNLPLSPKIGTYFDQRFEKYYRIRAKKSRGEASEDELKWYQDIRKDETFLEQLKVFRHLLHGHHITSIALGLERESPLASCFYPIRYLGDAKEGYFVAPEFKPLSNASRSKGIKHVRSYLNELRSWQKEKWNRAIKAASLKQVKVFNGSWGKSFSGTTSLIEGILEQQFKREELNDTDLKLAKDLAFRWLRDLNRDIESFAKNHPNDIFVFSAGNKKDDNDEIIHFPSNARAHNIFAVAASDGAGDRAYFSNFGKKTVDIFAPGLAKTGLDFRGRPIEVNGTSQAAPQVAGTLAKVQEILGDRLSAGQLRELLFKTADPSEKLEGLAVESSVINPERTLFAAREFKKTKRWRASIRQSFVEFPARSFDSISSKNQTDALEIPLPEPF